MTPRVVAAGAAAALLLAAAWWFCSSSGTGGADELDAELPDPDDPATYDPEPDLTDTMSAALATARNLLLPSPAADMRMSAAGRAWLRGRERCRLARYRLGDGGWTIGWGHYSPDSAPPPPERIDQATADLWFDNDVADRAERWVQAYVSVPVTQNEFDGLCSMAFNLSPKSFRRIADAVNAGLDPEPIALQYVRAGTNLEAGLRDRRALEMARFRSTETFA